MVPNNKNILKNNKMDFVPRVNDFIDVISNSITKVVDGVEITFHLDTITFLLKAYTMTEEREIVCIFSLDKSKEDHASYDDYYGFK